MRFHSETSVFKFTKNLVDGTYINPHGFLRMETILVQTTIVLVAGKKGISPIFSLR